MVQRHRSIGAQSADPLIVQRYHPIAQIGRLHITYIQLTCKMDECIVQWGSALTVFVLAQSD